MCLPNAAPGCRHFSTSKHAEGIKTASDIVKNSSFVHELKDVHSWNEEEQLVSGKIGDRILHYTKSLLKPTDDQQIGSLFVKIPQHLAKGAGSNSII